MKKMYPILLVLLFAGCAMFSAFRLPKSVTKIAVLYPAADVSVDGSVLRLARRALELELTKKHFSVVPEENIDLALNKRNISIAAANGSVKKDLSAILSELSADAAAFITIKKLDKKSELLNVTYSSTADIRVLDKSGKVLFDNSAEARLKQKLGTYPKDIPQKLSKINREYAPIIVKIIKAVIR